MPVPRALIVTAVAALTLVGGPLLVPDTPAPDTVPGPSLAGPDGRFATLAGVDVHHRVTGPDDGPPLVLLHHFYGSVATWRHSLDDLADPYRVAAFDRPGFGLTERPARDDWGDTNPYTRATSAAITLGLLDELGADEAVLLGASAGGTVALETYARAPERVRALVLVAPAITGDVGAPGFLRPVLRTPQAARLGPRLVRRVAGEVDRDRVAGGWFDPSRATDDDVEAYAQPLQVDRWDEGLWHVFSAEPPPNLSDLLPRIEVPTLVVSGDSDRTIAPRFNRRTASRIPGAEYVELEGCGHTPHEECPQEFATAVRDFLDRLPG